jgi:hypothetical protein
MMKKHIVGLGVVLNLVCMLMLAPLAMAQPVENFHAVLAGDNQPSPVDTRARGLVTFQLSKDRTKLAYKVIVANIQDVIGAHIHLAPQGTNGPIVLSLLPDPANFPPPFIADPGVTVNGILVEGTAIGSDLVGLLAGSSLESLISEIKAGNAYVNVHTVANRPGEIRGQIE